MQVSKYSLDICKLNSCDYKCCIHLPHFLLCTLDYNPSNTFTTQLYLSSGVLKKTNVWSGQLFNVWVGSGFSNFFLKNQTNSQAANSLWTQIDFSLCFFGGVKQKLEVSLCSQATFDNLVVVTYTCFYTLLSTQKRDKRGCACRVLLLCPLYVHYQLID